MLKYRNYIHIYILTIVIIVVSIIPNVNKILFNRHSGLGIILIIIAMPWFLISLIKYLKEAEQFTFIRVIINVLIFMIISLIPAFLLSNIFSGFTVLNYWFPLILGPIILVSEYFKLY